MSTDYFNGWTVCKRLLEELGIRRDVAKAPAANRFVPDPDQLDTGALQTLGGRIVICPIGAVVVDQGEDTQHQIDGEEWISAASTIPEEKWR